jgi:hypothetical protein
MEKKMIDWNDWEQTELPKILSGECWSSETKMKIDAAFSAYCGLEGLRGAFYVGVESCNCEGMIPNPYPSDDPKHRAFVAGYQFARKLWSDDEVETIEARLARKAKIADAQTAAATPSLGQMTTEQRHKLLYGD